VGREDRMGKGDQGGMKVTGKRRHRHRTKVCRKQEQYSAASYRGKACYYEGGLFNSYLKPGCPRNIFVVFPTSFQLGSSHPGSYVKQSKNLSRVCARNH